jgi:hypothetical protein
MEMFEMKIVRLYLLVRVLASLLVAHAQELPDGSSYPIHGTGRCLDISDGYIKDLSGNQYDVGKLQPVETVIAPWGLDGGGQASIFRAFYDDGETTLLVQKDGQGSIVYAELSGRSQSSPLHFVRTSDCNEDELFVFAETQVNDMEYEGLDFGDEGNFTDGIDDFEPETRSDHIYVAGDGSSLDCRSFIVVKVGIIYDAEFCQKYGGHAEAESRIMLIVAATSLLYENEMCVKLKLVGIFTPDSDCSKTSVFSSMHRETACGSGATSESFIRYFANWMNQNRADTGMDPDAVVHAFTGSPVRGTLGCAYNGSACRSPKFAYGVDYMSSNFLSSQSIIFAHELGHNLNARHLTSYQTGGKNYIMKPTLQNPNDGFGALSIERILNFLDSPEVTCDYVSYQVPSSAPARPLTFAPFSAPSPKPPVSSSSPVRATTVSPIPRPTSKPAPVTVPPSPGCGFDVSEIESLCFLPSDGLFGCVEVGHLVSFKPNTFCTDSNPVIDRIALKSCGENVERRNEELPNDEGRRRGLEKGADMAPRMLSSQVTNNRALVSFASDECGNLGCTAVKNYICFATFLETGQSERKYTLGFEAFIDGRLDQFTTSVRVIRAGASQGCISPATSCLDW